MSDLTATLYAHNFDGPGASRARALLREHGWRVRLEHDRRFENTSFVVMTQHGMLESIEAVEDLVLNTRQPL